VPPSSDPIEFNVWIFPTGKRMHALSHAGAVGMTALIWLVDWKTGAEVGLSLFYLVPVALVSWRTGLLAGLVFAALAGGAWFLADAMAVHPYTHASWIPVWNALIRAGMFAALSVTLARLRAALDQEKRLSRLDPLTGVWNSRAFIEIVEQELARCRRYNRPVSLVFMDVDDFKRVNDSLGHGAGDLVLKSISAAMRDCLREVDSLARLGGDEFAALLPETGAEEADAAVRKILRQAADSAAASGVRVTLSAGVTTCATRYPEADELIGRADALMYGAKGAGKDTLRQEVF
jgi:diguanylate cyclase (GGDEF)-like protein